MDSISYWALLWNWVERRVLHRQAERLLPRHRRWTDFVREIESGSSAPVLPPAAVRALERQLNAVTPRHVRISIRSGPQGTALRVWSWRWMQWSSSMHGRSDDDDGGEIEDQLINVLLGVQWFICNCAKQAWPATTLLPAAPTEPSRESFDQRADELDALVPQPEATIENGQARLWWERGGHLILSLERIPL